MNTYINYDLRITSMGESYHLRADCPLAGQETGLCTIPFSDEEIQQFLWQEMSLSPKEMGRRLYDAIFQQNIGIHLRTCLSMAKAQKDNLRIRLHLNESSLLAQLPWEYLYDTARDDFFALSIQTPIVRYLDMSLAESSMQVEEPLHILVIIADPVDLQPRLDVEREWILLRAAFQDLVDAQKIRLHRLPNANKLELQRYLRGNRIDIFHFIGHGYFDEQDGEGNLIFEDGQRQAEPISADALARLLKDKMPHLVYLNSCDTAQTGPYDPLTGTAQKLVQHGIPAVVAMQSTIRDDKAIQIAHEFYLALTDGYPVDAALVEGRKAVFNNDGLSQWGTPVLFMRAPDGILWDQGEVKQIDDESFDVSLPPPAKKTSTISSNSTDKSKKSKRYTWGCYTEIVGACLLGLMAFLIAFYFDHIPYPPDTQAPHSAQTETSIPAEISTITSMPTLTPTSTPTATSTPTSTVIPTLTPTPTATTIATPMPGVFSCESVNDIPLLECEALVAFYEDTGGPNWNDNTGWLATDIACNWYGVKCQNRHIVQLQLSGDWGLPFGLTGDLPPEISNLVNLDVLNLYWNELSTIPVEIGKLSRLSSLNLGHNKLSVLPSEIGKLSELSHLYLDGNQLDTLPPEIGDLSRLEWLNININPLPAELWKLSRLKGLYLGGSQLSALPAEIDSLSRLIQLDISHNNLKTLPKEIGKLSRLVSLNLNNNEISRLPAEIDGLSSLEELNLSNNDFSAWPAEINTFSNLARLDLSGNFLSALPVEISNFSRLDELILADNNFSTWPVEIQTLSSLTSLDLSGNFLKTLPVEIDSLSRLDELILADNSFSTWPVEIQTLSNLTTLDLSKNLLKILPAEIGTLTNLTSLNLSGNSLKTLPAEVGTLSNLGWLYLHQNLVEELPAEIGNLSNLQELLVWDNNLQTLPAEIGNLSRLKGLYIANNKLQTLPVEIGKLSNLEVLEIPWNQLSTLPTSFAKLINVEDLKLEANHLAVTDPELLGWMNAKDSDWADNQTSK